MKAELSCNDCPAINLKKQILIDHCEYLKQEAIKKMGTIKIFLLGESLPENRYIYDLSTDYTNNGLRYNLRMELTNGGPNEQLLNYLNKRGILITDCALCPLHKLDNNKDRRTAATICLKRNTRYYLDSFPEAKIITFFPSSCGFKKKELPDLAKRIQKEFNFNKLEGLKEVVNNLLMGVN